MDPEGVSALLERAGLVGEAWVVTHEVVNRKKNVTITRKFVQGRFTKPDDAAPPPP